MRTVDRADSAFSLIPVQEFRCLLKLPDDFDLFQLCSPQRNILPDSEHTKDAIDRISDGLLKSIPDKIPFAGWMSICLTLQIQFRHLLNGISEQTDVEGIVAGLGEVCQRFVNALLDAQIKQKDIPQFSEIFAEWRRESIEIPEEITIFNHDGDLWKVRPIKYAFGHLGICVETDKGIFYIYDPQLIYPSEGHIYHILRAITLKLQSAMLQNQYYD